MALLTNNIVDGLVHASADVQQRMLVQFRKADLDYGDRVDRELQRRG